MRNFCDAFGHQSGSDCEGVFDAGDVCAEERCGELSDEGYQCEDQYRLRG